MPLQEIIPKFVIMLNTSVPIEFGINKGYYIYILGNTLSYTYKLTIRAGKERRFKTKEIIYILKCSIYL